MLKIDDIRTLHGFTVHGDDQSDHTFYIMPEHPTFARMPTGGLSLRLVEYGQLREDGGKKFGGFIAFDAELSVPDDAQTKIVAALQGEVDRIYNQSGRQPPKVAIAPINWTDGTVELLLAEGGQLIEKIRGAGKPSLYGRNIASFTMELSELGTAIFKETLSTGAASTVTVVYKLNYYGRLPPMTAWGTWNASEFYSFFQDINTEDNFWSEDSYTEIVSSSRYKNDVTKTHFEFVQNPNLKTEDQAKLEDSIRATINKQLEQAVQRNLLKEIAEVDPDTKELRESQDIEDVRRSVMKTQIANVRVEWSESKAVIVGKNPQGQLPSVTSMKDGQNRPVKWEDYYTKLNVDEFLKTVQVTMRVNADFATLPIHSVEVKINYAHGPNAKVQEFTFTKPDDVAKFEAFVHQSIRKFKYSYAVNYKGSSFRFQSPDIETDDTNLTINVDDLGVLVLDIAPGDVNFTQVPRAQIVVRYDTGATPIEAKFNMTKDASAFRVREIIQKPRTAPIRYQITYQMADGREIKTAEREQQAKDLYIDDPFTAIKTVGFRAVGDLDNQIASITVEAAYVDLANNFKQTKTLNLSKATPGMDWEFPVVDDTAGKVTYSGMITLKDGTTRQIAETPTTRSIVQVGLVVSKFLEISVVPDLLDWTKVKLANVSLAYADPPNNIDEKMDLRFKNGDAEKKWRVAIMDTTKTAYQVRKTYFLTNGSRVSDPPDGQPPKTQADLSVFLELPA